MWRMAVIALRIRPTFRRLEAFENAARAVEIAEGKAYYHHSLDCRVTTRQLPIACDCGTKEMQDAIDALVALHKKGETNARR